MGIPSKQTLAIFDPSAGYCHLAESLAPHFRNVLYYSFWQTAFPLSRDAMPGVGLEGVERVEDFFDSLERADLCFFPDVGNLGLQKHLRKIGYPVFGSAEGGRLEVDRYLLKTVLHELGCDIAGGPKGAPEGIIHGVEAFRKWLLKDEEAFVKFSYFRGDLETRKHTNFFLENEFWDDLFARLGPFGQLAQFIVEEPISDDDAVEWGLDTFCVNGELLTPSLHGIEIKDAMFIGTTAEIPERLWEVSNTLTPVLKELGYRGYLSNEVRFTKDRAYLIDVTARAPCPPSEVQTLLIDNLADIISEGAEGKVAEPQFSARYAAQIILRSEWVTEHYLGLEIGDPDHVRIHGHCRVNGRDYAVSPSEIREFGGACGIGNTVEDAVRMAFEAAESVKGFQIEYDGAAAEKAMEAIEKGEALGLPFGSVIKGETRLPPE